MGKGTGSALWERELVQYCEKWDWFSIVRNGTDSASWESGLVQHHGKGD